VSETTESVAATESVATPKASEAVPTAKGPMSPAEGPAAERTATAAKGSAEIRAAAEGPAGRWRSDDRNARNGD
jgi:hypothetical protein